MVVVVANAFEALAVATVLPITSAQLGGLALYGWAFSAFMLTNLVGITLGGRQSDQRGPAAPFFTGTVLFVAGLAVSGFAPSMAVIVAGRALQGTGAGLLSATAYAAIALAYDVDQQPRMLATISSAWVVPGLVGPGLAGVIATQVGWRWVFLGLIPLPLFASALVLPALRALRPRAPAQPQPSRIPLALLLATGTGVALAGLSSARGWVAAALVLAGGALALHALRGLLPAGTLTARPGLPAAIACMGLITFSFFGTEAFVPLALNQVRGASVLLGGAALTAAAITWTLGAWVPLRLASKVRRPTIIRSGLGILAAGLCATAALLAPQVPAASAVASWGLAGFGMGLAFTTTTSAILESAQKGQEGLAAASLQLSQVLGTALATGAGGAIVASPFAGDPPRAGIAAVDLLMVLAALLAMLLANRVPDRAPTHPKPDDHSQ